MTTVDVVVVGLGAMGCASLYELARRGVSVLGLERHRVGHALGSSHGGTRVIRKAYAEEPRYVPLVIRAYELWADLEARAGRRLLEITGGVHIGAPEHPSIRSIERAVSLHGLACERLTASDVRSRFPAFDPGDGDVGLLEPDAGVLAVEPALAAFVELATAAGAMVREGVEVVAVEPTSAGVEVVTAAGERISAAAAIVAPGGHAADGMPVDIGVPLEVSRQVQCWFQPADPRPFEPGLFPIFIHHTGDGEFYGLPAADRGGIKVCQHHGGASCSISEIDRAVGDADIEPVRRYLGRHLAAANGALIDASVCLYTNTPDRHFVVDRLADAPAVVCAAGFSGHGFKFAPVIGEICADLATTGVSAHDIELFAATRFAPRR